MGGSANAGKNPHLHESIQGDGPQISVHLVVAFAIICHPHISDWVVKLGISERVHLQLRERRSQLSLPALRRSCQTVRV